MYNPCLETDSYKLTHYRQYPPGTQKVYSYLESRGGVDATVFFGLQYYLMKYWEGPIVTTDAINEAEELTDLHFGQKGLFNRAGWEHIRDHHEGRLPVVIRAVDEGTVVPSKNALLTIMNTDEFITRE